MPRDGNGNYSRPYNWEADRDASIPITASRMDDDTDDMANEMTNSVAKDGQSTMTGTLKMGTNKVTGMADGTALTDAATLKQVQNSAGKYAIDTGSANTYVIAPSPTVTAYQDTQEFSFLAANTNTGASTLNVSALGAVNILKLGQPLVAGDITANDLVVVRKQGSQFHMISPARTPVITNSSIGNAAIADNAITQAKIADDAVGLDEMASGTAGNLITYNSSGNPVAVSTGNKGNVLLSGGTGNQPAFGTILPNASAVKTDTFSVTNTSFVDVTGLSATITPSDTTSKILIMAMISVSGANDAQKNFAIDRNGTRIGLGDTASNRTRITTGTNTDNGDSITNLSIIYVDSPASTSALTYKIQVSCNGANAVYINRSNTDVDDTAHSRGISTLYLFEVRQ